MLTPHMFKRDHKSTIQITGITLGNKIVGYLVRGLRKDFWGKRLLKKGIGGDGENFPGAYWWQPVVLVRVVNLNYSEVQDRVMLTGRHMVRDVSCKNCDAKLGWIYEFATEENQRYKEGRVILERALVTESDGIDERGWTQEKLSGSDEDIRGSGLGGGRVIEMDKG
ncbi:unnamed protein product [Allacma fusca]|uniref:Yippee domain-containing protein n=1 Tax=Allacma fusca TaxID=39272 RepID=A0A8J2NKJ4_9HEXA|nr:unnamed protein product [Allacma fusca]